MNLKFDPEWKKYERDMTDPDPEKARRAGEAFQEIRQHEMETSGAARRWEEDRRAGWAADKHEWKKKQLAEVKAERDRIYNKYKNGGLIMERLKPAPGFVLVKPVKKEEKKTESGILLADTAELPEPNRGTVVGVGKEKKHAGGIIEEAPCAMGEVVLYKFGTLELNLSGVKHYLMGFGDVLGVLEDKE